MLFPDEALSEYVLVDLAEEVAINAPPPINPLPCDRWIARSCLQKAIRRAEPELAQRALANLFEYDRRATWRHLVIIATEDVGVANIDVLARIVVVGRNRRWCQTVGGEWSVLAELVRQMAVSNHCQAACDLLLRVTNDPSLQAVRDIAMEADMADLTNIIASSSQSITARGIAVLAAGSGLADGQMHRDPMVVFDTLAELGHFSHVVSTCRAAWKIGRNPMALLLPLIWQARAAEDRASVADDPMRSVQLIAGVPGYALDQFTRRGNAVARSLISETPALGQLLDDAHVRTSDRVSTVGDLVFLLEGGRCVGG